ncbi:MAG TPA: DPP IV N-terminal domain-containing protein, partial [Thermomicrobiales bacterium]|nr:DPP IV N-terminal domain-containing protein [Thermomicrobiales bacterium]
QWQIYAMDADGSNVRRLTHSETADTFPAVSPDGTRIVYTAYAHGTGEYQSEIYLMDADGGHVTRLTSTVALNATPCWSPDGTKIAFFSDRDGNDNIYTMNADGSDVRRLTVDGDNETPSWGYLVTAPATPTGAPASVTVRLAPLNNSGVAGTAVLTDLGDGTTRVVITLDGAPDGVVRPVHIHEGTCAALDPTPRYPLSNIVNGRSDTIVHVPLGDLLARPYAINAHLGARRARRLRRLRRDRGSRRRAARAVDVRRPTGGRRCSLGWPAALAC